MVTTTSTSGRARTPAQRRRIAARRRRPGRRRSRWPAPAISARIARPLVSSASPRLSLTVITAKPRRRGVAAVLLRRSWRLRRSTSGKCPVLGRAFPRRTDGACERTLKILGSVAYGAETLARGCVVTGETKLWTSPEWKAQKRRAADDPARRGRSRSPPGHPRARRASSRRRRRSRRKPSTSRGEARPDAARGARPRLAGAGRRALDLGAGRRPGREDPLCRASTVDGDTVLLELSDPEIDQTAARGRVAAPGGGGRLRQPARPSSRASS